MPHSSFKSKWNNTSIDFLQGAIDFNIDSYGPQSIGVFSPSSHALRIPTSRGIPWSKGGLLTLVGESDEAWRHRHGSPVVSKHPKQHRGFQWTSGFEWYNMGIFPSIVVANTACRGAPTVLWRSISFLKHRWDETLCPFCRGTTKRTSSSIFQS